MGTTKTGRTLNTHGARGAASQYAVVHSNEGGLYKAWKESTYKIEGGWSRSGRNE